ncbi:Nuclear factor of activated T-cells, cytoplasmic 1, partial [Xenotaenia resolanae]
LVFLLTSASLLSHQLYGYMESEPLTLQLFIGTADDRLLRPHAFYQVHRITGKTVSTASHEVMQSNTKILEIPLLPENNMRAIIDCAGILKLRNSDIELRKGETDIGRKNTRVRLVFRVHINQPNGRTVSLQVASNPIECSQRSAQELPLVEKQSVESYPATGGKMMMLGGLNFLPESKVVFVEKAQDGHHLWETEAKVDKDSMKSTTLAVEIPPYKNQRISSPVQVNFYVCNGKRKRSQYQRFTYVPANGNHQPDLQETNICILTSIISSLSVTVNMPHATSICSPYLPGVFDILSGNS